MIGHGLAATAGGIPTRALAGPLAGRLLGETGPLVVALHGLAESGRYWNPALASLARRHRVAVVDLLGFGESPWPDLGYSAEAHAAAVAETLHRSGLGREPAVLIGHQAGATVALAHARDHAETVRAVIGLGTPWFRSPAEARRALRGPWWLSRWLVEHTDRARLLCRTLCGGRSRLVPRLARWFAPGDVPDEVIEDAFLHTWASFSQTLASCLVEARLPEVVGAGFPVPVLALHGDDDALVPVENLVDAADGRSILTVERVAGQGHNLAWSVPELLAEAVTEAARPRRAATARPAVLDRAEHTVAEAARMVRTSRRTVLSWVEAGRLRWRRDGTRVVVDRASLLEHAFGSEAAARHLLAATWLSAAEAAARLGVGHATLARHVAAGMPSHRVAGRRIFLAEEIDVWARERRGPTVRPGAGR